MNITLIQSDIKWENIQSNLDLFSEKIDSIIYRTDLIILPEMFATGFSMQPEKFKAYTELQLNWLAKQAKLKNCVVTGSIIREDKNRYYNSIIWMKPDGEYLVYNKRHLFSYAEEHLHYTPGSESITPQIGAFRIRPLICYDLRFPVWSRNKNDYELLIYVANWPNIRIDAWKTLLKARAIENLCYVVGVNRVGSDGNNIEHSGHSCVFDFKGNELLGFEPYKEGIKTLELDSDTLNAFRKKFPAGDDADDFTILVH